MFLRKYQRTKDGKRHTCFALDESQRTERGPRQRVVAQLGELTEDQQQLWLPTAVFHTRHQEGQELPLFLDAEATPQSPDPDVVRIRLGKVGWTNARAFGDAECDRGGSMKARLATVAEAEPRQDRGPAYQDGSRDRFPSHEGGD